MLPAPRARVNDVRSAAIPASGSPRWASRTPSVARPCACSATAPACRASATACSATGSAPANSPSSIRWVASAASTRARSADGGPPGSSATASSLASTAARGSPASHRYLPSRSSSRTRPSGPAAPDRASASAAHPAACSGSPAQLAACAASSNNPGPGRGQPRFQVDGQRVIPDRLRVGACRHGLARRGKGRGGRTVLAAGQVPVLGQAALARPGSRSERFGEGPVQPAALARQQVIVKHLPDQPVRKGVPLALGDEQPRRDRLPGGGEQPLSPPARRSQRAVRATSRRRRPTPGPPPPGPGR